MVHVYVMIIMQFLTHTIKKDLEAKKKKDLEAVCMICVM